MDEVIKFSESSGVSGLFLIEIIPKKVDELETLQHFDCIYM